MVGFGAIAPILVLYLEQLHFSARKIGLFLSLTLLGDVVLAFAVSRNYAALLVAATLGVISPSGNEVGPFNALETAMLGQLAPAQDRVFILMYYQLLGFVGLALGSVGSGFLVAHLQAHSSVGTAYRTVFAFYASVGFIKTLMSACLTDVTELEKQDQGARHADERRPLLPTTPTIRPSRSSPHIDILVSPSSRPSKSPPRIRLGLVIALFGIDAFASSLTPASYVALFLQRIYGASIETITTVLAGAALSAVVFSLGTGALVKRIGLVPAMVTTHIPAQLITCGLAFAPTLPAAISLYIARTSLSSMDASIRVSSGASDDAW
ncbi:hypothetical protein C6P46_006514 [Rhodotorula mucilaginosa]|uniref:MFS transporter n=1 Tax=Rhodotorula mucilaginosa TaxID=5537 RepID=A0A9P7B3N6_RHOMI|nr:hypothetical protein C6P46_006514 [Rhodotorula mucilaginosa]